MQRSIKSTVVALGLLLLSVLPVIAANNTINFDPSQNGLNGGKTGLSSITRITFLASGKDPITISINIINSGLALLGLFSVIFLLYAGILWFKAGDNEEDITKAKDILKGSLIGLVISLSALAISYTLYNYVVAPATQSKTDTTQTQQT